MLIKKIIPLKVALLLLSNILFSCSNNSVYEYNEGFSKYMKDTYNIYIENDKNTIYYLLPLSDCNSCMSTELNLEMLSALPKSSISKISLIVIGKTKREDFKEAINDLENKYKNILFDKNNKIYSYQTNIGKPLIIRINSGKCIYYNEIYDTKIDTIKTYLIKL